MTLAPAPLFADVARAPEDGAAHWLTCADGVRIRVAAWAEGARGTVLMFPGRTEYVEKYGPAAAEFGARGYAMIAVDWRGQGLADRQLNDPDTGHVTTFRDYQHDVAAVMTAARALALPEPYFLIGHSMGGCIGLRALMEGLPVKAAVFSAPMWGIRIAPALRPVAWSIAAASRRVGQGHRYAPGTSAASYVVAAEFAGNVLTTDPGMYDFMKAQIAAHPELALGGPSLHWLHEALHETRALRRRASPPVPALTVLGSLERVVEPRMVHERMARWPGGRLELIEGAEHEAMMETSAIRARFYDLATETFSLRTGASSSARV